MTPEQTIELANQAGITFITKSGVASATEEWLVEFARLVGNAKLEEAAVICDELQDVPATEPRHCAQDIRGLKS